MESKRKATAHLKVSVLLVSLDRLCHKCFQNTYVNTHVMSIRFVSGNLFPSTTITSLQIHSAFIILWFTVFIIFILFSILFYSIDYFNKNYLLIIFFITTIEIFRLKSKKNWAIFAPARNHFNRLTNSNFILLFATPFYFILYYSFPFCSLFHFFFSLFFIENNYNLASLNSI